MRTSPTGNNTRFLAFASREEASGALAEQVFETLTDALAAHGKSTLVVSGGTSPVAFFHRLRRLPLPWERITVVPSDERTVPMDDPQRNEAMIRRELLQGEAAAARLHGLLPASGDTSSLEEIAEALPTSFDAVVLGMGEDGHTASLFPGSPQLDASLRSTEPLALLDVPALGAKRVSLTPSVLLSTRRVDLLFFGRGKRDVFEAALAGDAIAEYPVRFLLLQNRAPVTVFWAP
ncbi:MAG: 6-phosphogluconolactonase [Lysobacterales bacterium]|jgi:6-phosphogluconolactonase